MDASRVAVLRELLSGTEWVQRTRTFGRTLQRSTAREDGLLLVGTPEDEPWHLAAHLDDESRYAGLPGLSPTLVRWAPPPGAPDHLSVGLARLEAARRGETVFVVAPDAPPESLLERVSDARRIGATVLSLDTGDADLASLAHESLVVPNAVVAFPDDIVVGAASFDTVQHLVSTAAGEVVSPAASRGLRDRLGRLLDVISGDR